MFGTETRHRYGENFTHLTSREDWDQLNRELFFSIVDRWRPALALLTNTAGRDAPLPIPRAMLRRDLDLPVEQLIKGLSPEHFQEIFTLAKKKQPDLSDCYRVTNLGLPDHALVYLIEHKDQTRRTMLVFGGERLKGDLEKNLTLVSEILNKTEEVPAQIPPAEAEKQLPAKALETEKIPPSFSRKFAMRKASLDDLEARRDYLSERRNRLDYKQRVELQALLVELAQRLTRH